MTKYECSCNYCSNSPRASIDKLEADHEESFTRFRRMASAIRRWSYKRRVYFERVTVNFERRGENLDLVLTSPHKGIVNFADYAAEFWDVVNQYLAVASGYDQRTGLDVLDDLEIGLNSWSIAIPIDVTTSDLPPATFWREFDRLSERLSNPEEHESLSLIRQIVARGVEKRLRRKRRLAPAEAA